MVGFYNLKGCGIALGTNNQQGAVLFVYIRFNLLRRFSFACLFPQIFSKGGLIGLETDCITSRV